MVVHGVVLADGRLALWAESRSAWERASTDASPAHPFAVAPPVAGTPATITLTLPVRSGRPEASPELGVGGGRPGKRSGAWNVPAIILAPGQDPEELLELARPPVVAGSSIGFLADLVAFAADLVERGRVLPSLVEPSGIEAAGPTDGDGWRAGWQAAVRGVDLARFDQLTRAMPAVARANQVWPAGLALRTALDAQVEAAVRAGLTKPLVPAGAPATAVSAWLGGLTGADATIDGDPADLRTLRDRVEQWQDSGGPGVLRTCFRLTYVDEGDRPDEPAGWLLEFLLQPVAEPSVLVPADVVWSDRASPLFAWVDYPQEVLLADLGRAGRLYPDLDEALREPDPVELFLDTAGAYRFLVHAPLLAEAGFGVLLPAEWQRPVELGLTFTVHSREAASPVLRDRTANLAAIVDYKWGLALGAEALSAEELAELARAKVPLVRLRGRWVYLEPTQLAAGLAFLTRGGSGQMTAGEALRRARLWPAEDQPLPLTAVGGTGWLADLLTGRIGERLELIESPETLHGTLRPYQRHGLSWLAFLDSLGVGALLADDMGLGKTVQLLALEALRRLEGPAALRRAEGPAAPTLIVCPLSVLGNWRREIERFTPQLRAVVHHGERRTWPEDCDLVLTTYNLVVRDIDRLSRTEWERVVLDEAQQVKNAGTATARAVRRLPARHRVALTGTPVENRLMELWSIMDFLNPGVLGPAPIFRARYSVPVERFADQPAASRLRQITRPFLLRRVKSDAAVIADLPEKFERIQWCNLTPEQASLYQAVVDELRLKLTESRPGNRRKGLVLSAMTKLKQVCNHPAQLLRDGSPVDGRSGKVTRLEEILTTALAEGDKALVFTQFTRLGSMLVPHLRNRLGTEVAFLHGGLAKGSRDALVDRFQSTGGPRVLLVSLKAGGTGLNLTAANQVIHVDRWWNPAAERQATDRAYRIGQQRNVQVHTFVCAGTIEERIDRILAEKQDLAESAMDAGEGWLTQLSTSDILELVRLAPEPLDD